VAQADAGDASARERLFSALYDELHRLAQREVRRQGGESPIHTTTLLHEVYLAVASGSELSFPSEGHFLAYAAKAMRGVLIDHVRHTRAQRRGGGVRATTLDTAHAQDVSDPDELIAIRDALEQLEQIDSALAHLVDLHFFCGFTFTEIGAMQGVTERTVQRQWVKARLLLRKLLGPSES
jgi:RNA polymerase sigma factor (TIGR02999 family)